MSTNDNTALAVRRGTAVVARIDEIAGGAMELFKQAGSFAAELAVAQAISDMRAALTPEVMKPVMALANTDLGFRTDRDPNGPGGKGSYSLDVVRECFIEAKLRGFHAIGNEFNIISGRFYAAKAGLRRKVMTWPGLTDFKDHFEVPRNGTGGAIVKCSAKWKLDGSPDAIEEEIPVKVNEYMGADAILGKAQRKLLKRVHDRLGGVSTPDGEVGDAIDTPPQEPITAPPPKPPAPRVPQTAAERPAQAALEAEMKAAVVRAEKAHAAHAKAQPEDEYFGGAVPLSEAAPGENPAADAHRAAQPDPRPVQETPVVQGDPPPGREPGADDDEPTPAEVATMALRTATNGPDIDKLMVRVKKSHEAGRISAEEKTELANEAGRQRARIAGGT